MNEWAFNYTSTGPGGVGVGLSDNRCTDGPPRVLSAPMPTPPFAQNTFFSAVGYLLGLYVHTTVGGRGAKELLGFGEKGEQGPDLALTVLRRVLCWVVMAFWGIVLMLIL